jgi:hypothetical protein
VAIKYSRSIRMQADQNEREHAPAELKKLDAEDLVHHGVLEKKPGLGLLWQERNCVLTGQRMLYFDGDKLKGAIHLDDVDSITGSESEPLQFSVVATARESMREYKFRAQGTTADRNKWVTLLSDLIADGTRNSVSERLKLSRDQALEHHSSYDDEMDKLVEETVLKVAYSSRQMRQRYAELIKACELARNGVRLKEAGFEREGDFELKCCLAEYAEVAGYDRSRPQRDSDFTKAIRIMDRSLYFEPSLHLPGVESVQDAMHEVYRAYAQCAYVLYKHAEQSRQRIIEQLDASDGGKRWCSWRVRLGSIKPDQNAGLYTEVERYDQLCADAQLKLEAWIAFLETVREWVKKWSVVGKQQDDHRTKNQHKLPPDDVVLLASEMLLFAARHRHLDLCQRLYNVSHDWLDFTSHLVTPRGAVFPIQTLLAHAMDDLETEIKDEVPVKENREYMASKASKETDRQLIISLSNRLPDLLSATRSGGWVGFASSRTRAKLQYRFKIAQGAVMTYVDWCLDVYNIHLFWVQQERFLAVISIACILLGVIMMCVQDAMLTSPLEERLGEAGRYQGEQTPSRRSTPRDEMKLLRAPLFWKRVLLNFSFTRMAREAWIAKLYLDKGRQPHSAFVVVKLVDGLFEAMPQSLMYCYVFMRDMQACTGDGWWDCSGYANVDATWTLDEKVFTPKFAGLLFSLASFAGALASMGQRVQGFWRVIFGAFCLVQALLRALTLCAAGLLAREWCKDHADAWCDAENGETPYGYILLMALYLWFTVSTSTVLHVVYLQGHAGASIGGCLKYRQDESNVSEGCCKKLALLCYRLTILNQHVAQAWVLGMLNCVVAFDTPPFKMLKNASPRPPRLSFFIFRASEILTVGFLWSWHLYQRHKVFGQEENISRAVVFLSCFLILFVMMLLLYVLCLLVPRTSHEILSNSARRALTVGQVSAGTQQQSAEFTAHRPRTFELTVAAILFLGMMVAMVVPMWTPEPSVACATNATNVTATCCASKDPTCVIDQSEFSTSCATMACCDDICFTNQSTSTSLWFTGDGWFWRDGGE